MTDTDRATTGDERRAALGDAIQPSRLQTVADVGRLIASLLADPRVPVSAKLGVGAGAAYVVLPVTVLSRRRRRRIGFVDVAVLGVAVRQLFVEAGYELIREHWTGTDAGFAWLLAISGVEA